VHKFPFLEISPIMKGTILYGPRDVRFEERDEPITAMTQIAIQEQLDSKGVDWMAKVSDDQYPR
jgi:hypothetical protein